MPCWVFVLAFSAALIAGQDANAQTRKFKSWSASCPEGACAGDTAAQAGKISLRLSRADSPVAPWHISLRGLVRSLAKTSPLTVQVDQGQPMRLAPGSGYRALDGEFFIVDQSALTALFPSMRRGNKLFVTFKHVQGIERRLEFSLSGLNATLLWIDERQDRVGSQQTVAPPGDGNATPQAAATPADERRAAAKPEPGPPVPAELLARHRADPDCMSGRTGPDQNAGVSGRLDASRSLFVLPCSSGAYNVLSKVYIHDSRYPKEIKPESFAAYSDRRGWYGKDYLINPAYDAAAKTLTAFEKGRGLGDCGSRVSYVWTESGLRMAQYRYWGKCDGSRMPDEWPVIYAFGKTGRTR